MSFGNNQWRRYERRRGREQPNEEGVVRIGTIGKRDQRRRVNVGLSL